MKIKNGFMLRNIAGNNLIIGVGEAAGVLNGVVTLNETGVFLWNLLVKGCEIEELILALMDEYEVSEQVATGDVNSFVNKLVNAKIAE